jgi:hypothetical protein
MKLITTDEKKTQGSPDQSLTLRTTQSELQLVRKVASWFKCLLKMCRPCRKKKIKV